jgi:hypothetical protein
MNLRAHRLIKNVMVYGFQIFQTSQKVWAIIVPIYIHWNSISRKKVSYKISIIVSLKTIYLYLSAIS